MAVALEWGVPTLDDMIVGPPQQLLPAFVRDVASKVRAR